MKNAGLLMMLISLVMVTGCSRGDERTADTGAQETSKSGSAPNSAREPGAWTYQSTEHNFSLDLPSAGWKEMTKKRFIADFWCPTRIGSPMLAGVSSVKRQTKEEFQTSIPQFKANVEKGGDYLLNPTFEEGQTDSGNPFIYVVLCEKGTAVSQFIYVATASVWLADKGITVTTVFEGQGRMKSKLFKSIEYADFEATAKAICLSPK